MLVTPVSSLVRGGGREVGVTKAQALPDMGLKARHLILSLNVLHGLGVLFACLLVLLLTSLFLATHPHQPSELCALTIVTECGKVPLGARGGFLRRG